MDKKINKDPKAFWIKCASYTVVLIVIIIFINNFLAQASVSTFRIDKNRISIAQATYGTFEDFIPVRGSVTPLKSFFLDAIDGGRVEEIFVEEGEIVTAGQPILELSNTNLQLDVISREAQVSEQLNNLRNTRLAMEQNRLFLKSELVELDYQIKRLGRLVNRRKELVEKNLIAIQHYEDSMDELEYFHSRREVTIESQEQDASMRLAQIDSLESGVEQLERNLEIARKNLKSLVIKALSGGQLTSLNAEIGESKAPGERIGQIDDIERFKLSVFIDEFYVTRTRTRTRTRTGQYAEFTLLGEPYQLEISKVYPEILNGQFEVDMTFIGAAPTDIRRGQTLQTRVQLGDANDALLLSRGGFFQDTGGHWAFVVDSNGRFAEKRAIRLGRRNPEYFEVLEGLQAGEQVIISEYTTYSEIDRIEFN